MQAVGCRDLQVSCKSILLAVCSRNVLQVLQMLVDSGLKGLRFVGFIEEVRTEALK